MDISNIYLIKRKFWNICTWLSKIGWLKMKKRKLLTNISWNMFVELHDGGAEHQELEQQVSAHPRLWIRWGWDCGFISFEYEGMRLNVRLIILELLEQYWAGCKHRLLIARYLHHHYEGARVAPWDGVVIISGVSFWIPGWNV